MLGRCMFDKELCYNCERFEPRSHLHDDIHPDDQTRPSYVIVLKRPKNGREGTKQGVHLSHRSTC